MSRETANKYKNRTIVLTVAPARAQPETLIGLRLKGERTQYVVALSDIYRLAALWHGQKEAAARRAARKAGIPWRRARAHFLAANSIPKFTRETPDLSAEPDAGNVAG